MEAQDREWLRANGHRIKIGVTDTGHHCLEFDDWNVYDATDDFLTEDCEEILGECLHYDKDSIWKIVFIESRITRAQVEEVVARISL